MSDVGMRGGGTAAYARTFRLLRAQSGGLDVLGVQEAGPPLRVMTRARNGVRMVALELEAAPADTTRIANVGIHAMEIANVGIHAMEPARMAGPPAPWSTDTLGDAALAALIRGRVRQAADSDRFSGVVLVARGDRVLVHEPVGYADRERRKRNTRSTRFETASVGKMFAGVAVAQLVRAGTLAFDDTLARMLPDYPNAEAARRTTLRQLLAHTAGAPEPFLSPRLATVPGTASHAEVLAALAAVVERASGLSYEDYLRRHVWGPAGMRAVHPTRPGADVAVAHARFTDRDPLGIGPWTADAAPPRRLGPVVRGFGGGAYTADDLFRFARALRTGRLLGAALTDSVVAGRAEAGGPTRYGFGVYTYERHGRRIVGHPGSNPNTGWDADVELLWDGEWTVVVVSKYDAPSGMMLSGRIQDLLARQPLTPSVRGPAARAVSTR